jgi:hypothetical protein
LVWFNQINKTNQTNQLNEIDQTDQMNKIRLHGTASVCQQDAEKVALLTRPTPAATSPARPEAAKTASLPMDAPFPMRCSCVAHSLTGERTASYNPLALGRMMKISSSIRRSLFGLSSLSGFLVERN